MEVLDQYWFILLFLITMIRHLFFIILLLYSATLSSQTKIGEEFNVSFSSFYYWESVGPVKKGFEELSLSQNFNVNMNKFIFLGLRSYVIRAKGNSTPNFTSWHYIIEPNIMFRAINIDWFNLMIELGYGYGDYCPNCTPAYENYNKNLHYLNGLIEIQFCPFKKTKSFWLTLSFATNNPLRKKSNMELHGYNLPLIGIQYRFGKIRKSE